MIQLRAAAATRDDGLHFARYLDQAAEGFFGRMLGRRSAEILAEAFTKPGHDLCYERVLFAERDTQVVGMACSFSAEQHLSSSDAPLREVKGFPTVRAWVVSLLAAPIMRALSSLDDGDFYLQALAVDPELRGAGIGTTLIAAVEERGRAAGAERLCLDVFSLNTGGRRLYERLGMTVASASPKLFFNPRWKLLRMAKPLGQEGRPATGE